MGGRGKSILTISENRKTTLSHLQRQKYEESLKAEISPHHQENSRASTVQWKLLRLRKWHRECKNGISDCPEVHVLPAARLAQTRSMVCLIPN